MRRVPSATSRTRPASLSTLRCCDTAGRLTGKPRARSPTALGLSATRSTISRRVESPRADKLAPADLWLAMAYGKPCLTILSRARPQRSQMGPGQCSWSTADLVLTRLEGIPSGSAPKHAHPAMTSVVPNTEVLVYNPVVVDFWSVDKHVKP